MKVKKRLNEVNGLVCLAFLIFVCATAWAQNPKPSGYVGSDACQDCHETEYENFKSYAKKAHSYESIKVMKKGLTEAEQYAVGSGRANLLNILDYSPENRCFQALYPPF